jgi:hypothetical protein
LDLQLSPLDCPEDGIEKSDRKPRICKIRLVIGLLWPTMTLQLSPLDRPEDGIVKVIESRKFLNSIFVRMLIGELNTYF